MEKIIEEPVRAGKSRRKKADSSVPFETQQSTIPKMSNKTTRSDVTFDPFPLSEEAEKKQTKLSTTKSKERDLRSRNAVQTHLRKI